ncbi:hypothetical protein GDO86_000510 [Hymenochirus boettgeri]|uniref:NADH dehydrogenase [ubiquinone] 1 subunit C1, mitochondrial n=1 Tax=Hymenochirus boettgeri TaxID=247094 RepID=A0A8T2KH30_9PIPI|nr:hypothetical protein GDO86_000510 [Hymenochirus boettgeri]
MFMSRATRPLGSPLNGLIRTMYTARKPDSSRPNWLRVSLALGSTVAIWTILIRQHNEDVAEYKKRNGLQ